MVDMSRVLQREETIWRYMDLWKFEAMLENDTNLYFTRSDMFKDPLEGKYGKLTIKNLEKKYLKLYGQIFVDNWKALYFSQGDYINAVKRNSLVSCWHKNSNENIKMWKEYTHSDKSIAIKTSIKNLHKSLDISKNNGFSIIFSEVEYIDFHNTIQEFEKHIIAPLFYKDIEYKDENELRVIVWKRPENNILNTGLSNFNVCNGGSLLIDLNILIDEIYISPNAPSGFENEIKELISKKIEIKTIKRSKFESYSKNFLSTK